MVCAHGVVSPHSLAGPGVSCSAALQARIRRAVARRAGVVYLPFFWRPVMALIRAIPEAVFRRVGL